MTKKTVTLIGHYCATGGISIHIKRLEKLLNESFTLQIIDESRLSDYDGGCFNLRNKQFLKYLKILFKTDIIHIHTSIPLLRLFHAIVGRLLFKKVIITIHSLSTIKNNAIFILVKFTLFFANKVILVSEEINSKFRYKKAIILPAFIPPDLNNEPDLPIEILTLFKNIGNKKIIVSNAYRINLHNGFDLYGIDLLINVARNLKKNNENILIVFIITTLEINKNVYDSYIDTINSEGLTEYIKLFPFSISFVKLIEYSDLVVRATNTDGDAITIREALYLGKPVIASDVVKRPNGTILFRNRDSDNLYEKIIDTLKINPKNIKNKKINYLEVYKSIYL